MYIGEWDEDGGGTGVIIYKDWTKYTSQWDKNLQRIGLGTQNYDNRNKPDQGE